MSQEQPLVSIGLPVFNGADTIRAALDSLLTQSYANIEIVISDNASTDGTGAICREYAARDTRVRYFANETNIGLIRNFRRVLKLSSGHYFLWMGADDVRPPTIVADHVAALEDNPRAVMVHGPILLSITGRDERVEKLNAMDLSAPGAAARVRVYTRELDCNAMVFGTYRREALLQLSFGRHYGQDYLLCLQACMLGPVAYSDSPMIIFRHRAYTAHDNPMHDIRPLVLQDLLVYRGPRRNKCWTVLPLGWYYAATSPGLDLPQRIACLWAHTTSYTRRYWRELVSELPYLLFTPLAWAFTPFAPASRRLKTALKSWGILGA